MKAKTLPKIALGAALVCLQGSLLAPQLFAKQSASARLVPGAFFAEGDKYKKQIALTFDDGPGASTGEVLDLLKKHDVKATFFVNGMHVKDHGAILKRIRDEGHDVGDHTFGHVNFHAYEKKHGIDKTKALVAKEMQRSRQAIFAVLGTYPQLCRMPHGYSRQWVRAIAKTNGYTLINWSFGADWEDMTPQAMAQAYIKHLTPGAILLMHDGGTKKQKILGFLEQVMTSAKEKGLVILPVSELLR